MPSKVVLLDTELGSDSVADLIAAGKVERYPCETFEKFEQAAWALFYGKIKGDLVVVDTVSTIVDRLTNDIAIDPGDIKPLEGKTYWTMRKKMRINQDMWNQINPMMTNILTIIRQLPIPTIFLVHEKERIDPTSEEEGDNAMREMPALPRKILMNVMAGSDMVFRMFRVVRPTYLDGKTIPANTRVIQIANTSDAATGVRVTPEQYVKLPNYIILPDNQCGLALLAQTMNGLPRKMTVYGYPKIGKSVFGCTLPN
jgi:hypothetical protein